MGFTSTRSRACVACRGTTLLCSASSSAHIEFCLLTFHKNDLLLSNWHSVYVPCAFHSKCRILGPSSLSRFNISKSWFNSRAICFGFCRLRQIRVFCKESLAFSPASNSTHAPYSCSGISSVGTYNIPV